MTKWLKRGVPREDKNLKSISHSYAKRHEKEIAEDIGGHTTKGSGSGNEKGDVRVDGLFRVECKCTKNKSYSLKLETLQKIEEESLSSGETPLLNLRFIDDVGNKKAGYYLVPEEFLIID